MYGKGKIIATSHDCYLNWLNNENQQTKTDTVKQSFMLNLKLWLCNGSELDASKIGILKDEFKNFDNFNLLKWYHSVNLSAETQTNLLSFIQDGGALFCGSTPWGYLSANPKKTLEDVCLLIFIIILYLIVHHFLFHY